MTNAPDRIWAQDADHDKCEYTGFGVWDDEFGNNQYSHVVEYVRADLFALQMKEIARLRDALVNIRTEEHMLDAAQVNYPEMKVHRRISLADKMIETARDALQYNPFNNED